MSPYTPDELPPPNLDMARLIRHVGPANAAIARYDGLLQSIVNPAIMLSPLTNREAVLSSKIEGTQATVDEVLEYEAGIEFSADKVGDIQEIVNYRTALMMASEAINSGPIDRRLILQMHSVLMDHARGAGKSPGEFRIDQNWIGTDGSTIENAKFVPPSPDVLPDALRDFEEYIASDDVDALIQCAVVHGQFEILHPFRDGNGRIGRLLVPLFLFQKRTLAKPMFYLSEYLEANRETYYQKLRAISDHGDWTGWIEFFLSAIKLQADENAKRVKSILALYEDMKGRLTSHLRSHYSLQVLDALFDKPVFQSGDFVLRSGIPKNSAMPILRKLRDGDERGKILIELRERKGRQPAILAFRDLLNCAEGRQAF